MFFFFFNSFVTFFIFVFFLFKICCWLLLFFLQFLFCLINVRVSLFFVSFFYLFFFISIYSFTFHFLLPSFTLLFTSLFSFSLSPLLLSSKHSLLPFVNSPLPSLHPISLPIVNISFYSLSYWLSLSLSLSWLLFYFRPPAAVVVNLAATLDSNTRMWEVGIFEISMAGLWSAPLERARLQWWRQFYIVWTNGNVSFSFSCGVIIIVYRVIGVGSGA